MMLRALSGFFLGTLRGRLILSVAVVHAVLMALFVADLTVRQRALLLNRQIDEATALSQILATSAAGWIVADDIAGLQELIDAQRGHAEMVFAMLADEQGRVMADTDKSRAGQYLRDLPGEARLTVLSRNPTLVDVAVPAMLGGRHVGWARVGIGQKVAGEKLAEITQNGVVYALAAILIGSVIAWLMGRQITRRLYAIQETFDAVRSGNRLARSPLAGSDEAAVMAREFNAMLDALAERETALGASENRYRSLIRKVQAAIVLHDYRGHVLDSNPLAQELLGLSAEQLAGKALIDPAWHFLREDGAVLPVAEYPVSQVLSRRQPLRGLVTGISHPERNEVAWVLVNAEPEYGDAGEIAQVIVSFVDISERKRAEEALRRLNRELRAISECNQILIRAEDEPSLLKDICRIICDEAGYRLAWVGYAENDDAKTIRPVAWAGFDSGYVEHAKLSWAEDNERGQGPAGSVIRSGEAIFVQDFANDPRMAPWRESALQRGYRSGVALPLKDEGGKAFAVLLIYSAEVNALIPEEIRLLEELAGDLAFGILVLRTRVERKRAEEVLRQREAELSESQRLAQIGSWDWDAENDTIWWSDEYYRIYGFDPEQSPPNYEEHKKAYTPESAERLDAAVKRTTETGEPYEVDLELARPTSATRWIVARGEAKRDASGKIWGLRGTAQNITERKRAEAALREGDIRYKQLLDSVTDYIYTVQVQDGHPVATAHGPGCLAVMGYSPDDYAADPGLWYRMVYEPDRAAVAAQAATVLAGNAVAPLEHRILHRDGSLRWVRNTCVPRYDQQRHLLGYDGLIADITERKRAEEALRSSEARLKDAQRIAHIGDWELDQTRNILTWSEEVYRLFEIDPRQFGASYEAFLEAIHPDDREFVNRAYTESIDNHVSYDIVHRLLMKDGRVKYVNERCETIYDADGKPQRSLGTIHDITERKRVEDALLFVAQRGWQTGAENFFDALAQFLGERLDMDYVLIDRIDENPEMAETVALYAKGAMAPNMRYALKGTPCESVMGQQLCVYRQNVQQLFPEDTLLVDMGAESYIGLPLWDSTGRPIGLIAVMGVRPLPDDAPVTQLLQVVATRAAAELERERSDRLLRAREHEFRTLAENLPDNVVRYDREGRTVYVNPVLEETLGTDAARMLGTRIREFHPDGSYEAYAQAVDAALASGEDREIELIVPVASKEPIVHQIRIIAERDEHGDVAGILAIGRDITERRRAEDEILKLNRELDRRVAERTAQLEEANKELEAFAYSVSHDLRAPLRHIDGFLQLLRERTAAATDADSRHYMATITAAARRMETLIDDLLSFSRMGRAEMARSRVDLGALVREVVHDLEAETHDRSIAWRIAELPMVSGDRAMLRVVLVNLLSNALKFTRQRTQAEIEIGSEAGHENETVIFVRDNGVGFDMRYADKLFGVFQRLHRADEFEGTGIGLANVRRVISRHGGRTWGEGRVGEGAVFRFSLPTIAMQGSTETQRS